MSGELVDRVDHFQDSMNKYGEDTLWACLSALKYAGVGAVTGFILGFMVSDNSKTR